MTTEQKNRPLRLIAPKKGRLKDDFAALLSDAGFSFEKENERHDFGTAIDQTATLENFETLLQRPADALANIARGVADMAVIGFDKYEEARCAAINNGQEPDFSIAATFNFAACALWIAGPEAAKLDAPDDLNGLRIATSYPETLRRWLNEQGIDNVTIIACEGGVEDAVRLDIADAVCDIVDSGKTLQANGLEKTICLFESAAVLVTGNTTKTALVQNITARLLAAENIDQPACTVTDMPAPINTGPGVAVPAYKVA